MTATPAASTAAEVPPWVPVPVEECVFLAPTPDQLAVLGLLARGLRHAEVARAMEVTEDVVRGRVEEARYRTGSRNTLNLIALCVSRGWVPPVPDPNHPPPRRWWSRTIRSLAKQAARQQAQREQAAANRAAADKAAAERERTRVRVRKILNLDG